MRVCKRHFCWMGAATLALAALLPQPPAHAATFYWDVNGTTTGAGGTAPAGTWNAAATTWNGVPDGTGAVQAWTAGNVAAFSAGSDATGTFTVTVDATQSIGGLRFEEGLVTLAGGTLSLAGNSDAFVDTGVQANVTSLLAGSARFTKTGAGTLVLSGESTGFSGVLALQEGTLRAVGPNTKALGAGTLELTGGTLHLMNDASLTFGRNTTLNGTVTIIADRITSAAADTTFTLGTLNVTGASAINLNRGTNITGGSIYGRATFGATTLGANLTINLGTTAIMALGAISETGGARTLTLTGGSSTNSILRLTGAATFTGGFIINSGRVYAEAANSLGASGSTTTVNAGNLELRHVDAALGRNLVYTNTAMLSFLSNASASYNIGSFTHTGGTLTLTAGRLSSTSVDPRTLTFNNAIVLGGPLVLNPTLDTTLLMTSAISEQGGARTVTKLGVGIALLNAPATYSGLTALGDGIMRLVVAEALPSGSGKGDLTLNPTVGLTAVLDLNGFNQTLNGLSSSGAGTSVIDNLAAGTATLTVGGADAGGSFLGTLQDTGGNLTLVKTGSGVLMLKGTSTHAGGTQVNGGVLGYGSTLAQSPTGTTEVGAGGTLGLAVGGAGYYSLANVDALFANTLANVNMAAGASVGIDTTQGSFVYPTNQTAARGLVKLGPNALTLSGANSYTGGTLVNEGTLVISSDVNLGATSGGLTLGNATTLQVTGTNNPTLTRSVTLAGAATFDITDAANLLTVNSSLTPGAVTKIGAGALRLTGNVTSNGNLTVSAGALSLAGAVNTGTGVTSLGSTGTLGRLVLETGSSLTTTTITVGGAAADYRGSLVIRGGDLNLTTTSTSLGISLGAIGYGGMFLSSGTVSTNRVDTQDGTTAASIAVLQVSGGTLNTENYIMFRNQRWEFTVTGGQVLRTGEHIALGYRGSATAQGAMTVAGGVVNNTGFSVTMGQQTNNTALARVGLNLNAGTLITNTILLYNGAGSATSGFVNFNGGTLRAGAASTTFVSPTSSGGTSTLTAYVNGAFGTFAGGAVIDSNGFNITIPTPLLAPTGNGVATIPLTNGGSGYYGAPYVEISGGGGSGATATAVVDLDPASGTYGKVLSIVITNPGIGYTSAPTVTLLGGGGSGVVLGTATTVANTSGGLVKNGAGILTLSGANTYTGGTTLNAGTVALGVDNALAATGNVTIAGGSILDINTRSNTVGTVTMQSGSITGTTGVLTSNAAFNLQSGTVSAILAGSAGITKSTAGTLTLSGTNTFTGPVSVTGGTLSFATSANLGAGGAGNTITVSGGGTLSHTGVDVIDLGTGRVLTLGAGGGVVNVASSTGGLIFSGGVNAASTGSLTKAGGGSLVLSGITNLNGGALTLSGGSLQAGFGTSGVGSLTIGPATVMDFRNGSAQALAGLSGLTIGDGARLGFELNGSAADSLSTLLAATVTGTITLDFFNLGSGVTATTYNLFTAPGGLAAANYVIGTGISGWNLSLSVTDTLVSLTANALQSYYWRGGQNSSWSTLGSGTANWTTDSAGLMNASQIPGLGAAVVFSATGAPFSSGSQITTTLDAPFTIDTLRFESMPSGVSSVTILPGVNGVLTMAPQTPTAGIEVLANAGIITIAAPLVVAAEQTWQVAGTGAGLVVSGGIAFTEAVTKSGAGPLTLSGTNTGSGGVFLNSGTLNLNSATALGTGVLTINGGALGNTSGGTVTLSNNNVQTWNGSFGFAGPNTLNLGSGAVTLAGTTTVNTTAGQLGVGGVISSGANAYGLVKTGAGTLALGATNTYLGGTVLDEGTLVFTANQNMTATTNTLTLGATAGSTSAYALDLSNASATFRGAALVQTNNTVPNTITIGSGQTLRLNSTFVVGYDSPAVTKTKLTLSGAGTFKIGDVGAPTNATVQIGNNLSTSVSNAATVDMSGLAVFYANLGTGTFRIGDTGNGGGGAGTGGGGSTVILAQNSTLLATTISLDSQTLATQNLQLGTGTNVLQANTFVMGGAAARGNGLLNFYGPTGTVVVRNLTGNGRAVMNVQNGAAATAGALFGVVDVTGHNADFLLSTLGVAGRSAGTTGGGTGTFSFDTGTLDATSVTLAIRTGTTMTSAAINGTMNLGGTTAGTSVIFGSLTMATNTASTATSTGSSTATLNISGIGTMNIGPLTMGTLALSGASATGGATATINISGGSTTLGSVAMATNASTATGATTATASLNISGGTVSVTGGISMGSTSGNALNIVNNSIALTGTGALTVGGDITQAGGVGTENATVTLNGGTLDMSGHAMGSAAGPVTFNAQAGTLRNLAGLNDGAGLTKTTTGVLVMEGTNSYAGNTTINDGRFQVGSSAGGSLTSTGTVTVVKASSTMAAAPVLSGGAIGTPGTGVIGGSVVVGNVALNTSRGVLAPGFGSPASSNMTLTIQGASGLTVASGSQLQLSITYATASQDAGILSALAGHTYTTALTYINNISPSWVTGGPALLSNHDFLDITGGLSLGTRNGAQGNGTVSLVDFGYLANAQAGDVFNLLDWAGVMGGTFSTGSGFTTGGVQGDFDLPTLSGGLAWDTSAFTTYGVLVVVSVPEPGLTHLLLLGLAAFSLRRRRRASI